MAKPVRARDFNPYTVGDVIYGSGRSAPNEGMKLDPLGYKTRELKHRVRRNAVSRRLKAGQAGKFNQADYLRQKG